MTESKLILHDLAHYLADLACSSNDIGLALKMLRKAYSDAGVGREASPETAKRISELEKQ